jgi:hypothetical protein
MKLPNPTGSYRFPIYCKIIEIKEINVDDNSPASVSKNKKRVTGIPVTP